MSDSGKEKSQIQNKDDQGASGSKQNITIGAAIAIGIGVGTALGAIFDNMTMGIALGVAAGALIGGFFSTLNNK